MSSGDFEALLRRREQLLTWFAAPAETPRARLFRALVGLVLVMRLSLLQASQGQWLAFAVVGAFGGLGVMVLGGRLWWSLCAVALWGQLLFCGDWLTQSLILALITAVGAFSGPPAPEGSDGDAMRAAHLLAVLTYAFAAFHKLNRDFFGEVSCAGHGWDALAELVGGLPAVQPVVPAALVVCIEVLIAVLLALRSRLALPIAVAFHLPLTVTLAPTFVFALLPAYVAALPYREGTTTRRRRTLNAVAIGVTTATIYTLAAVAPTFVNISKCAFVAGLAGYLWPGIDGPAAADGSAPTACSAGLLSRRVAVGVFSLACVLPYIGTKTQHSAAMLSNLRVDEGCWNHWVIPQSLRRYDGYVRIESASIGARNEEARGNARYAQLERTLLDGLWSPYALRRMRENWCTAATTPIRISASWRGEALQIDDLCAPSAELPRSRGVFGGGAIFPRVLRYQKNVSRHCPQQCVH